MRASELVKIKATKDTTIYLDMDGVLANFFAEYAKLADVKSYRDIPAAKVDPILDSLIGTDFFARLPEFPTADQLVNLAISYAGSYSICSSPLRNDYANSEKWKKIWIKEHLNPQPQTIQITSNKAQFATNGQTPNILIDDKGTNIDAWRKAGGIGIKYQADEDSLQIVKDQLDQAYSTVALKEDEFNKCYDYAEQLFNRAKEKGLDAELVQVAGYQGDDSKADERWKEIPKKYWKHYVVKMGTTVLDPSASQFDPNAETKYPERTLNKMWDEQYVIKEMDESLDHFYGLDPNNLSYRHKIGKVYGKKNLKVPHAKYVSKRTKK